MSRRRYVKRELTADDEKRIVWLLSEGLSAQKVALRVGFTIDVVREIGRKHQMFNRRGPGQAWRDGDL
jgi:hypothetical protein